MIICANCHKKLGILSKKVFVHKGFLDDVYSCSEECKNELMKRANRDFEDMVKSEKAHGKGFICLSCDYKWQSKKSFGIPTICPKCKKNNIKRYAETKEWEDIVRKHKRNHISSYLDNYGHSAKFSDFPKR